MYLIMSFPFKLTEQLEFFVLKHPFSTTYLGPGCRDSQADMSRSLCLQPSLLALLKEYHGFSKSVERLTVFSSEKPTAPLLLPKELRGKLVAK